MYFQITHASTAARWLVCVAFGGLTSLLFLCPAPAQDVAGMQRVAVEQPRFVPIGTRSLVDQYRDQHPSQNRVGFGGMSSDRMRSGDRYTVRLQQNGFAAPPLPDSNAGVFSGGNPPPMALPDNLGAAPVAPEMTTRSGPTSMPPSNSVPVTNTAPASSLPMMPSTTALPSSALPLNSYPRGVPGASLPANQVFPSTADMAPMIRPQLNDGFATVGNSCCVSPPSTYVAAMGWGNCTGGYQATAMPTYIAPAPQMTGPQAASVVPSGLVPITRPSAPGVPKRPLISLGQDSNSVVVGQGLVGQPVAYVPGQCFRNWIRYVFP